MAKLSTRRTCAVVGQGSFLLLALLLLLSSALFGDLETARGCQESLALTFDAGLLAGFGLGVGLARRFRAVPWSTSRGALWAVGLACGLSAAVMMRSGMLFDAAPFDLLAGDVLLGVFMALAASGWWLVLLSGRAEESLLFFAKSLAAASVAFVVVGLLPGGVARLVGSLVAPVACALCLFMLGEERARDAEADRDLEPVRDEADPPSVPGRLPRVLVVSIVLAVFVADLLMTLFPIALFTEVSPLLGLLTGNPQTVMVGSLTQPALIAAVLLAVFALFYGLLVSRFGMRLPLLGAVGFFAVAVGFVTFPYHAPGGAPIGIAEAGRCAVVVYGVTIVRLYCVGDDWRRWVGPSLRLALACTAAMVVADLVVVALYRLPAFDYMDFQMRTVFGGAGLLALVLLLLGPLHQVHDAVRHRQEPPRMAEDGSALQGATAEPGLTPEAQAQQRLQSFAEAYHLSPRESEIVGLLSQGRDVPYIEQELVLSKSTVKTHIRHIYEKCGVSSRQDLLDLLLGLDGE